MEEKLRGSEERLSIVIKTVHLGMFIIVSKHIELLLMILLYKSFVVPCWQEA